MEKFKNFDIFDNRCGTFDRISFFFSIFRRDRKFFEADKSILILFSTRKWRNYVIQCKIQISVNNKSILDAGIYWFIVLNMNKIYHIKYLTNCLHALLIIFEPLFVWQIYYMPSLLYPPSCFTAIVTSRHETCNPSNAEGIDWSTVILSSRDWRTESVMNSGINRLVSFN